MTRADCEPLDNSLCVLSDSGILALFPTSQNIRIRAGYELNFISRNFVDKTLNLRSMHDFILFLDRLSALLPELRFRIDVKKNRRQAGLFRTVDCRSQGERMLDKLRRIKTGI